MAACTPTEPFKSTVPASSSKRSTTRRKTSPYFKPTFQFTTPIQHATVSTKSTNKNTRKKSTVAEEISKRIDSAPELGQKTEGASNLATGMQKVGGTQSEWLSAAKEKNITSLEALKELTKMVEKIKFNVKKQ